jgi:hypothetical protein
MAIQANERLMLLFEFDQPGFQLLLDILKASSPIAVMTDTLRDARRRISQAPRAAARDSEPIRLLFEWVYLRHFVPPIPCETAAAFLEDIGID